jgi:uncharacterized protein YktA (UPF0223 family)
MKLLKNLPILLLFCFSATGLEALAQVNTANPVRVNDHKTIFETPAVYELMHIAFALTDTGNYAGSLNIYYNVVDTSTPYYKEVISHFSVHKNHPLILHLNKQLEKSLMSYLYNLQKAYNSGLIDHKIKRDFQFPFFQRLLHSSKSVSRNLMEDFAEKSGFSSFYENHRAAYLLALEDAKGKLNMQAAESWLSTEFPFSYDTFRIVISPLMNATHFTKRFTFRGNKTSVMWVKDGSGYNPALFSQTQIAGLYTGVVFTEIDHNYVNKVSDGYKKEIGRIMGDNNRANWIKPDGDGKYYSNGYKIFNEYMTHAVYLLYTGTVYPKADQLVLEKSRIKLMEERRGYLRFEKFFNQLSMLYQTRKEGETIANLYPKMLDWCNRQNGE